MALSRSAPPSRWLSRSAPKAQSVSKPTAPAALPLVAILIGSVMFGTGMAMVGTCGFGSLVRLGTGDLRSLVVILILGGLQFLPALALGPIVEHFQVLAAVAGA
jgi:uncharacterized membrane protein YedE/YeeE